jgi:transposase-like protein
MNANDEVLKTVAGSKNSGLSEEEKAQCARRFLESGLSLREFSAQNGLGYMALWRWVQRERKQAVTVSTSAAPSFTEIQLSAAAPAPPWVAEWSLPNGAVLRVSKEVPAAVLEQLLRLC